MAFNIETTIEDMAGAISGVMAGEWGGIKDCVQQALKEEKEALADIADARVAGDINDAEMKSQLEDEKVALEAALLACRVKAKVAAQNAANAAIDVLKSAIKAAL